MNFVNEAGWERVLRIIVGIVLLYLGFGAVVTGTWGTVLIIIGFIMLITGLIGWCPLYTLLGTGTKKEAERVPTGGAAPPPSPEAAPGPAEPVGGVEEEEEEGGGEETPPEERTPGPGGY